MILRRTTCRTVKNLLPLHSGGDLAPHEAATVEEHLGACLSCFREFRELTTMRERLGVLTEQPLPAGVLDGFAEEIMARIAVGEPGPRADLPVAMERARRWPRYAAAAALFVAAGLGLHAAGAFAGGGAGPAELQPTEFAAAETNTDLTDALRADDALADLAPDGDSGQALAAADDLGIFAPPVDDDSTRPLMRPPVYEGSRGRDGTAVVSESTGPWGHVPHAMPSLTEGARVLVDAAGSRVILVLPPGGGLQEEPGRELRLREP